jgi:hypothetical protein
MGVIALCGQVNAEGRSVWSLGRGQLGLGGGTDGESDTLLMLTIHKPILGRLWLLCRMLAIISLLQL